MAEGSEENWSQEHCQGAAHDHLLGPLAVEEMLGDLLRWAGEVAAEHAATSKSRQTWLRRQAQEDASLAGLLVDLVEKRSPVALQLRSGRQHQGQIIALGTDFVLLGGHRRAARNSAVADRKARPWNSNERGRAILIRTSCLAWLRSAPGIETALPSGNRQDAVVPKDLAAVISGLVSERPRLLIGFDGNAEPIAGELHSAGRDLLTMRLEGNPPPSLYLPFAAVSDVSVLLSG